MISLSPAGLINIYYWVSKFRTLLFYYFQEPHLHFIHGSTCHSPWQAREDGPHKPPVARERIDEDEIPFPDGVSTNFGYPDTANAFFQARLPSNMKWDGKKSRCVSFMTEHMAGKRGTNRTKIQAIQAAAAWCWSWWESLSDAEKSAIKTTSKPSASSTRGCKRGGDEGGEVGASSSSGHKRSKKWIGFDNDSIWLLPMAGHEAGYQSCEETFLSSWYVGLAILVWVAAGGLNEKTSWLISWYFKFFR